MRAELRDLQASLESTVENRKMKLISLMWMVVAMAGCVGQSGKEGGEWVEKPNETAPGSRSEFVPSFQGTSMSAGLPTPIDKQPAPLTAEDCARINEKTGTCDIFDPATKACVPPQACDFVQGCTPNFCVWDADCGSGQCNTGRCVIAPATGRCPATVPGAADCAVAPAGSACIVGAGGPGCSGACVNGACRLPAGLPTPSC